MADAVTKGSVIVRYAIVCDEVRREDNGKYFLIGLYGSDIAVEQLPANLLLTFVLFMEGGKGVESVIEVRIMFEGRELATGTVKASNVEPGRGMIGMPALPLTGLDKEGTISLETRQGKGKWQSVLELPLKLNPRTK